MLKLFAAPQKLILVTDPFSVRNVERTLFMEQPLEFIRESKVEKSPFDVRHVGNLSTLIINFLDSLEFILARTLMNVVNVGSTLLMVETLKYIRVFTILRNRKNVGRPSVENQRWFDMLNLIL